MDRRLTLDLESITVTSFEVDSDANDQSHMASGIPDCSQCNTRLTCSSGLC